MLRIEKAERAKADLLEIWKYVALDSLERAERLIDELDEALNKLAEYPDVGRNRDELSKGLTSFPVGNYVVYYRKLSTLKGIEVVRVLHGRRDVEAGFHVF